jgi:SAM-dependent methyltransferase
LSIAVLEKAREGGAHMLSGAVLDPQALDELVRVTKPGGTIVFSMRTDYYSEGGFDVRQAALEAAGKWRLLERSAPFQAMPDGEPEIWHELWAYEVL